jgi:hypothetical protein
MIEVSIEELNLFWIIKLIIHVCRIEGAKGDALHSSGAGTEAGKSQKRVHECACMSERKNGVW